jgi:hypothetical protein
MHFGSHESGPFVTTRSQRAGLDVRDCIADVFEHLCNLSFIEIYLYKDPEQLETHLARASLRAPRKRQ